MQKRRMLTIGLCSLMAVGLCVFAVGHAQAASGNGPYYAEPSWSQKLPAATRFVVLTDWNSEAVLDRETGLVWERSPTTTVEFWGLPQNECIRRTTGGRMGWRLPSVHELLSLVDPNQNNPALPLGHPFTNVQPVDYWSITTRASTPNLAWYLNLGTGGTALSDKSQSLLFWCVRGGNNPEAY